MPFTIKPRERLGTMKLLLSSLPECTPEEKKRRIHSIEVLHALELFSTKKYDLAMNQFLKLEVDPVDVIKLLPEVDSKSSGEKVEGKKLKGKDLENALQALIVYLEKLRVNRLSSDKPSSIQTGSGSDQHDSSNTNSQDYNTQQLELIDTTLLKCYLQTSSPSVASLLQHNNCRLEEAEKALLHYRRHSEMIILYKTKGQHMKALQLLRERSKQSDVNLKGYQGLKNYLQQLGPDYIDLILEFTDLILKESPADGLGIFTDKKVENLPRQKILNFLRREHEHLVIPYLEHIIHTWDETNAMFHEALINKYRDKVMLKDVNITEEDLHHTKWKLVAFLESSSHYNPERVLPHFPTDSLFEERAIVLGKLGRHEQALAIYVLILGYVERAIRYCEEVCTTASDKHQDVYVILMRILMHPELGTFLNGPLASVPRHPNTAAPDLETVLNILEKYADKITPLKALSVLPDFVPLIHLKYFLETALDTQHALKRRLQVVKGLLYAEHIQVEEEKQFYESKSVVINENDVCLVCKKRFGNQTAFVAYPNGDIVHYSCKYDRIVYN